MPNICKTCPRRASFHGLCDTCRGIPVPPVRRPKRVVASRKSAHPIANTRQWRRLAKSLLQQDPFCKRCERMGKRRVATQVDHVLPARLFPDRMMDPDNTQNLCKPCHDVKSGGERRGFGYDYRRRVAYDLAEVAA